ncbi:MAG: hypothetical protein K2K48_04990 [Anaeroplasmataceae bacterium]|nr:hypothetical protein [Anaeroplasmataceae bacterium]MDE6414749.1 hypothetical protein [Anaeroplasmataceae bacterium]
MLKKLNVIHIILLILDIAVIPIIGFIQGFESPDTFITVLATILLGHPLIYLIMMVVKTSMILDYEAPRFMPLCMILTILLGCLMWYCFFHVAFVFANTIALWYGLVLMAFAVPYIIFKILTWNADKNSKDGQGPKIIRNK